MSKLLLNGPCRIALQVCAAGALAAMVSGCSSDSTRLGDALGNPFSSGDTVSSIKPRRVGSASDVIPAGRTPPVMSQNLAPRAAGTATALSTRQPISRETTGSIEPTPVHTGVAASSNGWTTAGGTPIQVADGESADVLANRYGVPAATLLQVNGLKSAADVRPGTRLTIPVYGAAPAGSRVAAAQPAPRAEPVQEVKPKAVKDGKLRHADTLAAAPVAPHAAGQRLGAPARAPAPATPHLASTPAAQAGAVKSKVVTAQVVPQKGTAPAAPGTVQPLKAAAPLKTAPLQQATLKPGSVKAAPLAAIKTAPVEPAKVAEPAPAPAAAPVAVASADPNPEFRWPARGRIIQGFKGGSTGNDGINIALPEGTSVKAAEGGVVAYAGSELKGYGNLVLIRHPNGFVSAYANNGEIDVKRGETVKRGQQIAKSGQSGNVSSPQLHFELRKGSTPVDPTQFLAGL